MIRGAFCVVVLKQGARKAALPVPTWYSGLVVASAIAVVISRCERHSAKHFSGFRRAKRHEVANSIVATTVAVARGKCRGAADVSNFHQLVGIGAVVAIRADGGSDRIDGDGSVAVMPPGDVPAAARCGIKCGWIIRSQPSVVTLSRKIGEVTPKLPSEPELFQTLCESKRFGNSPLSVAIPQVTVTGVVVPGVVVGTLTTVVPFGPPAHPSGRVSPIVTVEAVPTYTLRLSTRLSG